MPIISAFPTGESTVDYTGPKSGLPSLEEGKVAYVTDEKRLYTGNADGTNTQIPNADDVKTDVSDAVSSHNSATDAHADKFAKYLPLSGGTMTGGIKGIKTPTEDTMTTPKSYVDAGLSSKAEVDLSNVVLGFEFKESTMPSSATWSSVTYGNGKFVAVAGGGSAAYSTDGITWTAATLPSSAFWHSVTYGDGKFVAIVDGSDVAAYSNDGITWTAATLPLSASWCSVTYGNGKFVAVATYSEMLAYSTDGITWTDATLPLSTSWCSVTYGNGKFVAVADASDTAAYSTDGITWTAATLPADTFWSSVTYGNGKFVAVAGGGSAAYSTDGITWTAATLPSSAFWHSVTYGDGKFVAIVDGSDVAAYSNDGITWTAATLPLSASWCSVTYGNGKFVAVASSSDVAAYSADGITWTVITLPSKGDWESVAYGDGKFVAVAKGSNAAAYAYLSSDVVDRLVDAGLAKAPVACKVTLTASGWDSTAKTQSATVSGVLEDESKQLIMPMPAGTSMSAYNEAGIQMTAQGNNSVTFTADTVPTADVEVWVVVQSVNDVTPIPTLDEASWSYISKQSLAGNAKNIWSVGDCKAVKLSGTASKLSLDTTLYVYILDFDHDQSSADGAKDGITFGTFKTAATDGIDVCLVSGDSDNSDFIMYPDSTNAGGWKNSDMRYNTLGSTNTQNGDATNTTATSPKANTLLSCFPAELRKVMRPMYIYSDNTGGGSDIASYVTGTLDYLPLLAEYEIHGSRHFANSAESTKQTQYAYFKNGNSKIKKRHDNLNSSGPWLCRSTYATHSGAFCCVATTGIATMSGVNISSGVAPMFKI